MIWYQTLVGTLPDPGLQQLKWCYDCQSYRYPDAFRRYRKDNLCRDCENLRNKVRMQQKRDERKNGS